MSTCSDDLTLDTGSPLPAMSMRLSSSPALPPGLGVYNPGASDAFPKLKSRGCRSLPAPNLCSTSTGIHYPPALPHWVEDHTVEVCYSCKESFSLLLRKHHCRICGRVFCYYCCHRYCLIPPPIQILENPTAPHAAPVSRLGCHRVCERCHGFIQDLQETHTTWLHLLEQCDIWDTYLNLKSWFSASAVSLKWNHTLFRKITWLRNLPNQPTSIDTTHFDTVNFLWRHRLELLDHSRWTLTLLKGMSPEWLEVDQKRVLKATSFVKRMVQNVSPRPPSLKESSAALQPHYVCGSDCKPHLTLFDVMEYIGSPTPNPGFVDMLLRKVTLTVGLFRAFLPILANFLMLESPTTHPVRSLLSHIISEHNPMLLLTFWWLKSMQDNGNQEQGSLYKFLWNQVSSQVSPPKLKVVLSQEQLVNKAFRLLYRATPSTVHDILQTLVGDFVMPQLQKGQDFQPLAWKVRKWKQMQSASQPWLVECLDTQGVSRGLLLKPDDVRIDYVVMSIIQVIDRILKEELHRDFGIMTYPVIPLGKNRGAIVTVAGSTTLFDIKYVQNKTLLVWIMNHNPAKTVQEIRRNFVYSCAAFSVITYLLGVGDRHLKNLMITEDGRLFHIDYTYLMGKDPQFLLPEIRVTPDMIEVMGTEDSIDYEHFKTCCHTIYNVLRRHIGFFRTMLVYLHKLNLLRIDLPHLHKQIDRRFRPGIVDAQAGFAFVSNIQCDKGSYSEYISDTCYYYTQRIASQPIPIIRPQG